MNLYCGIVLCFTCFFETFQFAFIEIIPKRLFYERYRCLLLPFTRLLPCAAVRRAAAVLRAAVLRAAAVRRAAVRSAWTSSFVVSDLPAYRAFCLCFG